ncbi:MAG TPA: hypothetical protein VFC05_02645 [Nitrososphaeraceae archaeon]|jgi:hypothetical protein|nr:hypothetical protein [Nitrososphaeraceae archaeon]
MLAKITSYTKNIVRGTELDIDEYGSIIPLGEFELTFSTDNRDIYELIKNSTYAAIFTKKDVNNQGSLISHIDEKSNNILLVIPMTLDELNDEKKNVIESSTKFKDKI